MSNPYCPDDFNHDGQINSQDADLWDEICGGSSHTSPEQAEADHNIHAQEAEELIIKLAIAGIVLKLLSILFC